MEKLLLRLSLIAIFILPLLPVSAQTASTEKTKSAAKSGVPAKFELEWSRPETPTVQAARARLALMQQKYRTGAVQSDAVDQVRFELDEMERHAPYSLMVLSRGGTLKEFMAVMSASEDVSFTLINAGEPVDLETSIPAFTLRNASWGTVIEVLANFLATRDLQLKLAGSDSPNLVESKSVVCVLRRVGPLAEKRPPSTYFESFPLGSYLSDQSVDDIVGAIRAGWELDPAHDRDALRLKFHPPTSILLVSGPPDAIAVASKVISQLKGKFDKDSKTNLKAHEQISPPDKK